MKAFRVTSPLLGLVGLIALGLVAMKLLTGDLSVTQAAYRIGILTVFLVLTDRLLLPVAKQLAQSGRPRA